MEYYLTGVFVLKINRKQSIQSYKPFNKVSRQNEKPLDKVSIGGNSKDNTFLMADKLRSMKSSRYMSPMESMLEAAPVAAGTVLGAPVGGLIAYAIMPNDIAGIAGAVIGGAVGGYLGDKFLSLG